VKQSPKKIRRIRKRARGRSVDEVAREFKLSVEAVREILASAHAHGAAPAEAAARIERALSWAVAIIVGAAPFAAIPRGQYNPSILPQSVFVVTGAFALLAAWLVRGALRGGTTLRRGPLLLAGTAFMAWALVSIAWAHSGRAVLERFALLAACAASCALAASALRSSRDRRRLTVAVAASGAAVAVVGLLQYYARVEWYPQVVSPASTFGNKNFAAQYMVLALPATAALFLDEDRPKAYWPLAGAVLVTSAMAFHAFSKAAWLAAALSVALFCALTGAHMMRAALRGTRPAWSRGKTAASAAAAALLVLAINTGPDGFEFRLGRAFGALGDVATDAASVASEGDAPAAARDAPEPPGAPLGGAPSLGIRLDLWRNTLAMVGDHPVAGVGLGNFRIEFPPYSNRVVPVAWFGAKLQPKHTHNDYLQILAELGIVGFGLMAWLLVAAVRTGTRALRRSSEGEGRAPYVVFAAVAGTAGLLVTAVFSFPFGTAVAPFAFAVLLGLLAAAGADEGAAEGSRGGSGVRVPGGAMWALAGVASFACCLAAWSGYHRIVGDRHFSRARLTTSCDVAIAEGAAALRHDPGVSEAHLFIARGYLAKGRPRDAVAHLMKLLEAEPHSMAVMTNLSAAYSKAGEHERAAECALRVLEMKPGSAVALSNLGYNYLNMKRTSEAEESFRKALRNDPSLAPARFGLGRIAHDAGRTDDALEEFRAAARLEPRTPRYREVLVEQLCKAGRTDEARAAAFAKPERASALYILGRFLTDAGDMEAALAPLGRAVELAPSSPEYQHRLGYAAFKSKRYPEAREAFARAVKLRPGWALARRSLGTVLYTFLGRQDAGVHHYREALRLDPKGADNVKMREIVRRWDASRGR
jgi:tetratricopeptide (TPR) repeat protein/O-antigen ligase